MKTKRRALGLFIAASIVLSCTLASASALILDKSTEVGESSIIVTITGTNDEDTSSFQPKLMQDGSELEVNKTVWDPETNTWVEEINAKLGDPVTFHISVVMTSVSAFCNISNSSIEVYDIAEDFQGEGILYVVLENDTLTISGDLYATVIGCGSGLNLFGFNFTCDDTGEVLAAEDTASVNIICPTPALTPTGLIALVGLLSAIAAVTVIRKRR
jgi:hypothetical protein